MGFPWLCSRLLGNPRPVWRGKWVVFGGSWKGWAIRFTSSMPLCRVPPALTSSSGLGPGHAAGKPVMWKLHRALQPQGGADEDEDEAPDVAQHIQGGGSQRHLGFRRSLAQHAQRGCMLSTCQVQSLSHHLWKLFNPENSQDTVPVDLSSANSFG